MRPGHDPIGTAQRLTLVSGVILALVFSARPASQGSPALYTLYTADGRRAIPYRTSGNTDMVSLDQLASLFSLTLTEDALVGGLTVQGRGETILLIPGQSFASIGPGRIVSLPGPVQHDRTGWQVPVDFLRLALGPALGLRVDMRKATRVILVGDVRLPTISARFDRQGPAARLTVEIDPATPHRTAREGTRLVIRFDAVALDMTPVTGLAPEFASAVHVDGTALVVDLGPSATTFRATDVDDTHLVIDLAPQVAPPIAPQSAPPPELTPRPQALSPPPPPPPVAAGPPGAVRTVVIDPGHGGDDEGTHGPGGTKEKDLVLAIGKRLKTAVETRTGLRVILTRETDVTMPFDQRMSLANNNKADLFLSLHANASVRGDVHGAQVLSLSLDTYKSRIDPTSLKELPVPVAGGGTREINVVPWDLAQIPFAAKSQAFAATVMRHLTERSVPLFERPVVELPLRTLVGANMPAVMVELGFLTSPDDEQALNGPDRSGAIIDAIATAIDEMRQGPVHP